MNEDDINFLSQFGFPRDKMIEAMRLKGNRDAALDWLLNNPDPSPAKPTQPAKPKATQQGGGGRGGTKKVVNKKSRTATTTKKKSPEKVDKAKEAKEQLQRAEERMHLEQELERERLSKISLTSSPMEDTESKLTTTIIAEKKKKEKKGETQNIAESVQRERKEDEERIQQYFARKGKRLTEETKLKDVTTALAYIKEAYGVSRHDFVCSLVSKLLTNIVDNLNEPKYRTLNTQHEKIEKLVLRTVGGSFIMRKAGFEEQDVDILPDDFAGIKRNKRCILQLNSPNKSTLKSVIKTCTSSSKKSVTVIPKVFGKINSKKVNVEARYFAAQVLRNLFSNLLSSPDDRDFRGIDTKSKAFKKRLAPISECLEILKKMGYEPPTENSIYYEYKPESVDADLIESAVNDLAGIINELGSKTPIFEKQKELITNDTTYTSKRPIKDFIELVEVCVNNLIETPHEQKFHKLNLDKIQKKTGIALKDAQTYIQLFSFDIDTTTNTANMAYPKGFDIDLLRRRLADSKRAWEYMKAELRKRKSVAS